MTKIVKQNKKMISLLNETGHRHTHVINAQHRSCLTIQSPFNRTKSKILYYKYRKQFSKTRHESWHLTWPGWLIHNWSDPTPSPSCDYRATRVSRSWVSRHDKEMAVDQETNSKVKASRTSFHNIHAEQYWVSQWM